MIKPTAVCIKQASSSSPRMPLIVLYSTNGGAIWSQWFPDKRPGRTRAKQRKRAERLVRQVKQYSARYLPNVRFEVCIIHNCFFTGAQNDGSNQ